MSLSSAPRPAIFPESTPNPLSNKFSVNRTLLGAGDGAGRDFTSAEAAAASPLAAELFQIPGVRGVYVGADFVTVSVHPGHDWWALRPLAVLALETFFDSGKPVLLDPARTEAAPGGGAAAPAPAAPKFSEIEARIVQVLETEIQPAVAMDGGYIAFAGYENGIVKVQLRGACHSCPSSIGTLKMGIETRLKQEFPEIVAVEAV